MQRREFLASSAAASIGLTMPATPAGAATHRERQASQGERGIEPRDQIQTPRQILIAGGGFGTAFIRYMAELTGKERPKLCYLPTASADRESGIIRWYENCAPLNVVP